MLSLQSGHHFCRDNIISFLELFSIVKMRKRKKVKVFYCSYKLTGLPPYAQVQPTFHWSLNFPFPDVTTLLLLYCLNKPSIELDFPFP